MTDIDWDQDLGTMPHFLFLSSREGENNIAWLLGSYPTMNVTLFPVRK